MTALVYDIIERAKKRANIPDGTPTTQANTLLQFAQEAMDEVVFPWLVGINEEFCLVEQTFQCRNNGVVLYPEGILPFPDRCYGRNLREIKYKDTSNNLFNVPLANLDDKDLFLRNPSIYANFTGAPAVYVLGDQICILAAIQSVMGSFILTFPVKVPTLSVSTSLHGDVIDITWLAGTTTFTIQSPGADFTTAIPLASTRRVDLYRRSSGAYLEIDLIMARAAANVGGNAILTTTQLTEDDANNLKMFQSGGGFAGIASNTPSMVLLPAETNNYCPVPQELDNYAVMALAERYLEATGDTEGIQVVQMKLKEAEKAASKALAKRVTGECKVFSNRRGLRAYFASGYLRRW